MMRRLCLSAAAALLTLAGCAHSPPTTLLTLDTAAPAGPVRASYRGQPITVPAVHLPALLDRAGYVRQFAPGQVQVDDFAHWAAPLGLLARDALVRDLTVRLPAGAVLPPGATEAHARVVNVTVLAFTDNASGARLDVAYRFLPAGTVRQASLSLPADETGPVASAARLSQLLGQLADRIAADAAP
jgi:hypothetical protein